MKRLFLSAAVAALAIAPFATAQQAPSLSLGGSASGAIAMSDPAQDDNIRYDDYSITLAANQAIVVTMDSTAFDSVLEIGRGRGAQFESLATDDDGGGASNARLRYRAEQAGVYTVRARAFEAASTGAYTLSVRERRITPETAPTPVAVGQSLKGAVADGGPRTEAEDRLYARYVLNAKKGQRLMFDLTSEAFDPVVEIGKGDGAAFEAIASDDDGGGAPNARLLTEIPDDGSYIIRTLAFDGATGGDFELKVSELPPPGKPARPVRLQTGRIAAGELSFSDPEKEGFKFYDLYELRGRAGERLLISLRSRSFDSFLEAGANTSLGFAVAQSDDDTGGELDAQMTVTFDRAGAVLVRASSVAAGATGAYSISVEPAPPEDPNANEEAPRGE